MEHWAVTIYIYYPEGVTNVDYEVLGRFIVFIVFAVVIDLTTPSTFPVHMPSEGIPVEEYLESARSV